MINIKAVNKFIQQKHPTLVLQKGKGYFYFTSDDNRIQQLETTSVYTYKINDLTLEQWLCEADEIKKQMEEQ